MDCAKPPLPRVRLRPPWSARPISATSPIPDTTPIERSHVPTKDRLRPLRGLPSIRTEQRAIGGGELAWAVQRGRVAAPDVVVGERHALADRGVLRRGLPGGQLGPVLAG